MTEQSTETASTPDEDGSDPAVAHCTETSWATRFFERVCRARGLLVGAVAAALAVAVVLGAMATHAANGGTDRDRVAAVIEAGAVCTSLPDPRYEVSCGTTAFGDVRFDCGSGRPGKCPTTTAVTLRNVSRTPVMVTMVSGTREGDRRFSPASELTPGRVVILRLHPFEKYLFDILVRSVTRGVGAVRVEAVD
ncbi:hypothetical protein [Streptomyces siamensis]